MNARMLNPIFALLTYLAASGLHQSAVAQTDPGMPIETKSRLPTDHSNDPVSVAAHGALFDANLKVIDPSPEFLRRTLDIYIKRLTAEANGRVRKTLDKQREFLVEESRTDEMTQRFLILEYLTNAVAPLDQADLEARIYGGMPQGPGADPAAMGRQWLDQDWRPQHQFPGFRQSRRCLARGQHRPEGVVRGAAPCCWLDDQRAGDHLSRHGKQQCLLL